LNSTFAAYIKEKNHTKYRQKHENQSCEKGPAMVQAIGSRIPTAAARVQPRVWSSGICGGQSGAGTGLFRVLRFCLPIFIPSISPSSESLGADTLSQLVADVPSGPSLDSTTNYENLILKSNATDL
jgi:hypothetical protein